VIFQEVVPLLWKKFVSSSRGGAKVEIGRKYFQGGALSAVFCTALWVGRPTAPIFQVEQRLDHLQPPARGARFVDQLVNNVANESKVGYQSLTKGTKGTKGISRQILKDAELLNDARVNGVNWHFFTSPVTGLGGPSQPLLEALEDVGIRVIIH